MAAAAAVVVVSYCLIHTYTLVSLCADDNSTMLVKLLIETKHLPHLTCYASCYNPWTTPDPIPPHSHPSNFQNNSFIFCLPPTFIPHYSYLDFSPSKMPTSYHYHRLIIIDIICYISTKCPVDQNTQTPSRCEMFALYVQPNLSYLTNNQSPCTSFDCHHLERLIDG